VILTENKIFFFKNTLPLLSRKAVKASADNRESTVFTYCSVCRVECKFARNEIKNVHTRNHILVLPSFHTEDQVFLEGDDLLREYVLADSGLIWRGSYNRLRPCIWNYAQFEKDILDCSLHLVSHVGKLTLAGRSDPVKTCRVLSAAVSTS
jgi:hypothetical protein